MTRFRTDNTDGYTETDLAALNAAWAVMRLKRVAAGDDRADDHREDDDPADFRAAFLDYCAERLLAAYDRGLRGEALTRWYYVE